MTMKARVKPDGPAWPITAFGGRADYVKREWRVVPAGFEDEARAHPYLLVEEEAPPVEEKAPVDLSALRREDPMPANPLFLGLSPNIVDQLLAVGGDTAEGIMQLGEDGLISIKGIGEATARKLLATATELRQDEPERLEESMAVVEIPPEQKPERRAK
jgi:hypothetical protein